MQSARSPIIEITLGYLIIDDHLLELKFDGPHTNIIQAHIAQIILRILFNINQLIGDCLVNVFKIICGQVQRHYHLVADLLVVVQFVDNLNTCDHTIFTITINFSNILRTQELKSKCWQLED